jgi:hypothetical protein
MKRLFLVVVSLLVCVRSAGAGTACQSTGIEDGGPTRRPEAPSLFSETLTPEYGEFSPITPLFPATVIRLEETDPRRCAATALSVALFGTLTSKLNSSFLADHSIERFTPGASQQPTLPPPKKGRVFAAVMAGAGVGLIVGGYALRDSGLKEIDGGEVKVIAGFGLAVVGAVLLIGGVVGLVVP